MGLCKRTKSKNIQDALLPMTILNWIIGCGGVIEFPLGKPHVIFSFIYSGICATAFGCLVYLSISNDHKIVSENLNHDYSDNNKTIFRVLLFANNVAVFIIIVMSWTRRQGLKLFIRKVKNSDDLLQKLGIPTNYDKIYNRQLCLTAFVILVNVALTTMNWNTAKFICLLCDWQIKIVFSSKHQYSLLLQYFNDFYFIGIIWCLKHKFEQLNDFLDKLSETSPSIPQYMKLIYFKTGISKASSIRLVKKTNDDTDAIRISKQIHLELVKLCRLNNNIFSLHLLQSLTISITAIIALLYTAYTEYVNSTKVAKYDQILRTCISIIFYSTKIFTVNYICDKTSHEAQRTGTIINELHEPATNKEFRTEIREFTLQLIQNPLTFTAYGFFNLDNTFTRKVVGSVTTYLIILIQMREMTYE